MSIFCEISLYKPVDSTFVPGETVAGVIKYGVDKDTPINKIISSFKGYGYLKVTDRRRKRKNQRFGFKNNEKYVDIDHVIQDLRGTVLTPGQYETNFRFQLPIDVPASFTYEDGYSSFYICCYISYYVSIQFKRPGMFKYDKFFRKKIPVVSGLKPRLPITPSIYSEQKQLFKPFASRNNIVDIKAVVEKCVIRPGGKIELNYEVFNDTNVTFKSVSTKLEEIHTFKPWAHGEIKVVKDVPFTETKTNQIKSGERQNILITINIPPKMASIENSTIVSREFFVKIIVKLPTPHFDAILEIPVQIGDEHNVVPVYSEPPPTYWEAMRQIENGDGD